MISLRIEAMPAPYSLRRHDLELGTARLDPRCRVEEPLCRTQCGRFAPRWSGELHADRDAQAVEAGSDGAGRQADQVLGRRVGHDELTEAELPAQMDDVLFTDH